MIETSRCPALVARVVVVFTVCGLAAACSMTPTPFTQAEFEEQAAAERAAIFADQPPLDGPLTLSEALARVLRYNLDRRARMMEEALALGQVRLDRYDLLPQLVANAGYTGRDEYNASTSKDLYTGASTDANPSYSSDKEVFTADLGLTWNILDFGASWYTAHQNSDRALIASERRRKAVATLAQEVRHAFWRAAAAQVLDERVAETITRGEAVLADLEIVERERLRPPTEVLRRQKTLLETMRQLEGIQQRMVSARAELAALINVPPGSPFTLDVGDPDAMAVPEVPVPIADLELAALVNNPDLREQVYLGRIATDETRKEILKLLPGITLDFSRQYDSNSLLAFNQWNHWGVQLTWNLLKLVSAPDRIAHAETAEEVAEARRLALRMAVLAQVHVVSHQLASTARQFERADRLWRIETRLAEASVNRQAGGAADPVERITQETAAIGAELRRFQTFAEAQMAYGRLMATVGVDPVPDTVAGHALPDLSQAIAARLDALARGEAWSDPPVTAAAETPPDAGLEDAAAPVSAPTDEAHRADPHPL
jgi:outer membrane protein TolC